LTNCKFRFEKVVVTVTTVTYQVAPVPWMILNCRIALYCTNNAYFGAHHGNLKEDRPILSAAKVANFSFMGV